MSKSIYEEANIILNGRIADGEVKSFRITGETYYKITNALKQAQKQEKLLELYKKLSNYVDEQTYAHELPEITELKIKIKENEK